MVSLPSILPVTRARGKNHGFYPCTLDILLCVCHSLAPESTIQRRQDVCEVRAETVIIKLTNLQSDAFEYFFAQRELVVVHVSIPNVYFMVSAVAAQTTFRKRIHSTGVRHFQKIETKTYSKPMRVRLRDDERLKMAWSIYGGMCNQILW